MSVFQRLIPALLLLTLMGCQTQFFARKAEPKTPVLSTQISCAALVEHLNLQTAGLRSWRSGETRVHVRMPGLPMPQSLSGTLACAAPSNFRLVAGNIVAHADFGANDERCWAYAKPGEPLVLTWLHEDSYLLSRLPGGLPHLDAGWLMGLLGVVPMHADDYELQHDPNDARTLRLVDVDETADGGHVRHVIAVDTLSGFAREHSLTDDAGVVLVRARLGDHRRVGTVLIPHEVRITFPETGTELTLNFNRIEVNCSIQPAVWEPPGGRELEQVDLRTVVESMERYSSAQRNAATQVSRGVPQPGGSEFRALDAGAGSQSDAVPQFDQPMPVEKSRWKRLPIFRWFSRS